MSDFSTGETADEGIFHDKEMSNYNDTNFTEKMMTLSFLSIH